MAKKYTVSDGKIVLSLEEAAKSGRMKLRDFQNHLPLHGCEFLRHGGGHDVWVNPRTSETTSVPGHREIQFGLARGIFGT